MTSERKLFMVMLGCKPEGRFTEQHDIFFGIGSSLKELVPAMKSFWPEAKGQIHIDAWREVTSVDGYKITIQERSENDTSEDQLFFVNLGGYKENEFEEYHYKILAVTKTKAEAIKKSKATTFYKHCGFKGAESHIDDKYGVDVDDIYNIEEMLSNEFKEKYQLSYTQMDTISEDEMHVGYVKIASLK
ncbi:DUF1543 domain-containing protein [Galbibacter mesophilus]|uniref:DUF1543 domain-containing protein n=1 Tax=Galbibacter mesophilus TaxID=379069 RepID=UPI00191E3BB9|nr:DUF1543 domain-containing protein [Galbibacter mesophilus]MCM5661653.1 DUF1543 domain-containing protein [Galbibacter mesophilus]